MALKPDEIRVHRLDLADIEPWIDMRIRLFPVDDRAASARDIREQLAKPNFVHFGACAPDGSWLGFIEVGTRDVAESCETSPVAYIEALWVEARARRSGVARRLVEAAIAWTREKGLAELASDVQIGNIVSQAVHERIGFEETERLVTYRMDLRVPGA